ncbi:hypothetical protein HY380_01050 [Candidatus Saccharibacteria bacterium]|nr:hypothetical protein [Candidatus Saccharibacteria bacterium]
MKKTVVICCSAAFYKHANQIADKLERMGYRAVVPETARNMKLGDDYDVAKVKTWLKNPADFKRKQQLATNHLREVAEGDAILIINDDKPGKPNYIGPNTMMEWGLAYHLRKPIFILHGVGKQAYNYEEVYGLSTVILDGDLSKIRL